MAATLFIHALIGCCCHHAHGVAPHDASQVAAAQSNTCCEHRHHASDERGQQSGGPCKSGAECQGVCTYLPPQKTQIDAPQFVISVDLMAGEFAAVGGHASSANRWERTRGWVESGSSLRLHLRHQVILI